MLNRALPFVAFAAVSALAVAHAGHAQSAPAAGKPQLVARFPTQQITGVAATADGRLFVNLPRWTVDVPVSVGEVKNGQITPFPSAEWNAWRNVKPLSPADHFICVQSVVADGRGNLWVLDPAAPGQQGPVPGGAKLVRIDLKSNAVAQVITFRPDVAIPGSYLNDIRFSPDGRFGYLSDSGIRGALVTVDLQSGRAWRVLDGHPSTQVEQGVVPQADGRELRRPDAREPKFAADGIALSPDGATFYWQALTGRTLYSLPTSVMQDQAGSAQAGDRVSKVATTHVADGFWIDARGRFYITDPEHESVQVADRPGAALRTLARDPAMRWPDSFAQGGPDGPVYVSSSHIQDSPWFKPQATTTPSEIWRLPPVR